MVDAATLTPQTTNGDAPCQSTSPLELEYRDDGSYVKREFPAPKTQVMGIVINGVLKGDLNWSMILIGSLIALMLELSGVSALAFAVGMYVPIANSAPIFVGGIVRYLVDRYLAGQAASEAESKMKRAIEPAGNDPAARMRAESEAKAQAEIDAIPGRVALAIERAARLLEPKVQTVTLERSTLRDTAEVEAWVERQKKRLIEAVGNGPVLVS